MAAHSYSRTAGVTGSSCFWFSLSLFPVERWCCLRSIKVSSASSFRNPIWYQISLEYGKSCILRWRLDQRETCKSYMLNERYYTYFMLCLCIYVQSNSLKLPQGPHVLCLTGWASRADGGAGEGGKPFPKSLDTMGLKYFLDCPIKESKSNHLKNCLKICQSNLRWSCKWHVVLLYSYAINDYLNYTGRPS